MAKENRKTKCRKGYIDIPYKLMSYAVEKGGRAGKLSASQLTAISLIFSYSRGGKYASLRFADFEKYGISESSAKRAMKVARDNGIIERGEKLSEYKFVKSGFQKPYLHTEKWLKFAKFDFGTGKERRLFDNEIRVLTYIKSWVDNMKGAPLLIGSNRGISRRLNICAETVNTIISRFKEAKLIYVVGRAVNGNIQSTYSINEKMYAEAKQRTEIQIKEREDTVREADERAKWESLSAHRRTVAQENADAANELAMSDEAYREAHQEVRALDVKIPKAEVEGVALDVIELMREKQRAAQRRRAERLVVLGIKEYELSPVYQCDKCSDTGFLANGKACSCYLRWRR